MIPSEEILLSAVRMLRAEHDQEMAAARALILDDKEIEHRQREGAKRKSSVHRFVDTGQVGTGLGYWGMR